MARTNRKDIALAIAEATADDGIPFQSEKVLKSHTFQKKHFKILRLSTLHQVSVQYGPATGTWEGELWTGFTGLLANEWRHGKLCP